MQRGDDTNRKVTSLSHHTATYLAQALQGGVHVARVAQINQARRENGAALREVLQYSQVTVDRAEATSAACTSLSRPKTKGKSKARNEIGKRVAKSASTELEGGGAPNGRCARGSSLSAAAEQAIGHVGTHELAIINNTVFEENKRSICQQKCTGALSVFLPLSSCLP